MILENNRIIIITKLKKGMNLIDTVQQQIINLREENGWSQIKLANKMGFCKSTMSKIESGSRKISLDEVKKFAILFGVTPNYLLGFDTDKNTFLENSLDFQALIESEENVYYAEEPLSQSDKITISHMIEGYSLKKKEITQ